MRFAIICLLAHFSILLATAGFSSLWPTVCIYFSAESRGDGREQFLLHKNAAGAACVVFAAAVVVCKSSCLFVFRTIHLREQLCFFVLICVCVFLFDRCVCCLLWVVQNKQMTVGNTYTVSWYGSGSTTAGTISLVWTSPSALTCCVLCSFGQGATSCTFYLSPATMPSGQTSANFCKHAGFLMFCSFWLLFGFASFLIFVC